MQVLQKYREISRHFIIIASIYLDIDRRGDSIHCHPIDPDKARERFCLVGLFRDVGIDRFRLTENKTDEQTHG